MQVRAILNLILLRYKRLLPDFILPVIVLIIISYLLLKNYFIFSGISIFGIILIPFVLKTDTRNKKTNIYLFVMSAFLILAYFCTINTLLYLASISGLLLIIEKNFGRQGFLPFLYLIVISPIFLYFGNFFGIPARLMLTEFAGYILNSIDFKNTVTGNLIITENSEFSVDPACMGLHMLNVSFMIAIVMAVHYERQFNKRLNFLMECAYLGTALLLSLIGNLIRIILLVVFEIAAENSMHDIIGLMCLIAYILLPLWFIAKLFYKKLGNEPEDQSSKEYKSPFVTIVTGLFILSVSGHFLKIKIDNVTHIPTVCLIDGYKKDRVSKDVLKFENENSLIYVKPVNSFYGAEHTPMICWVGSGYEFKQIKKMKINNQIIFFGILTKGKDQIYSSWWFDNGSQKTIDQFTWRWDVVKGAHPYSLINVNTKDEESLYTETKKMITKNIFITQ